MTDTVSSCLLRVAQAHFDHPAVMDDMGTLTYGQMLNGASAVASSLHRWYQIHHMRDVVANDVIGVALPRGMNLYIAIWGVLLAGANYVPLDPDLPDEVRRNLISASGCRVALTDGSNRLSDACASLPITCAELAKVSEYQIARAPTAESGDPCYTLFTSGSTGQPKGVQVSHAAVLNLARWAITEFNLGPTRKVLQYSTINFDASVLDIFPAHLAGAALCVPSTEQRLSTRELASFCDRHDVNQAFLPPSLLAVLPATAFMGVDTILTGGEACTPSVIAAWAPGRRFFNLYGPTECTVLVTARRMARGDDPKLLGHPISGMRLYVVDDDGRPASCGELLAAGVQVSNEYVANPEATAERFVRWPELDAELLYRTGDIVERDANGSLRFVGRKDRQVKIRGFRVELEEIEGALVALGCTGAAVIVSPRATLVAYVSCPDALSFDTLRVHLLARLHAFKVPEHIVRLPRLPLKTSGKIDYQRLPVYVPGGMDSEHANVLSEHEHAVAQLWSEILEIDVHAIGPDANFRTLGGTSIDIVHLVVALEERFGIRMSFIDIFERPTIDHLTKQLITHQEKSCFQP